MQKQKAILAMAIFIFIATISYLSYEKSDSHSQNTRVKISINEWAGYSPVVYAKLAGLFEQHGLPVDIIYMPGQSESNNSFIKGQVQGLGSVLSDVVLMRSSGIKIKVVTISDYSEEGDVIVANQSINKVADLKGKTIGIDGLNSFSHMYVLEELKRNGIKENEVNFKIIPYSKVGEALSNHLVDAAHTWNPGKIEAIKAGHKVISKAGNIPGLILDTFSFNEEFIEKNPYFIEKFIKVFYLAQEEMRKDPIKSSELLKSFYHNNPYEHAKSFNDIHFVNFDEYKNYLNTKSNNSIFTIIKKYGQFYLERGQINDPDAYKSVIYGVTIL